MSNIVQMLLGGLLMKKLREPSKKKLCLEEVMAWFDRRAVVVRKEATNSRAPNGRGFPLSGRLQRSKKGACVEVVAQILVLSQGKQVLAASEVWLVTDLDEDLKKAFGVNLAMNINL